MKLLTLVLLSALAFLGTDAKLKLPKSVSQHQYCMSCIATVKEIEKKLGKRRMTGGNKEAKIIEVIENICAPPNFVEYDYSPPKTVKACEILLENHEEDLEAAFFKDASDVKKLICYEKSEACRGVDIENKSKPSKLADIDLSGKDASKTVEIDPNNLRSSEKKVKTKENEGKTLTKKTKAKKEKAKKETKKKETKKKSDSKKNGGDGMGSLNHINVDINDPDSMQRVMDQIKNLQQESDDGQKNKEEL